ncbi:hypothetical protein HA44_06735 [Mixta gaviniae]|nr:hypothetical protein HA44_06735 [Mixta gaviniae]
MLQKEIFPANTKWTIIAIGTLAGLLWALPSGLHLQGRYSFYLPPLVLSAACVLAFTLYRLNAVKPWLGALLTLPFIALMTGWRRWNFPEMTAGEFHFQNSCAIIFLLMLAMPFLAAFCNEPAQKQGKGALSAFITGALWNNTFTFGVTAIMTGLFWLVLMLWSKLFSMIGIKLFEQLFFDNAFFPSMATGAVIAAGIVFCRRLPGAAGMYRNLITLAVNVLLPLHAITSLLFLACLPFTGLAIIPKSFFSRNAAALHDTADAGIQRDSGRKRARGITLAACGCPSGTGCAISYAATGSAGWLGAVAAYRRIWLDGRARLRCGYRTACL